VHITSRLAGREPSLGERHINKRRTAAVNRPDGPIDADAPRGASTNQDAAAAGWGRGVAGIQARRDGFRVREDVPDDRGIV
jgi:hypothetical protein